MSATAPPAGGARGTGGTACPRCGAHVGDDQDWCLNCGDAARTRLVPTPNWRLPIGITAIVAALALLAIAVSFVRLTRDDAPVTPTAPAATTTTTAPPATTAPPTTTAPPATTAPPTTTTAPGATTTAPGATTTTPGATAPAPAQTTTTP